MRPLSVQTGDFMDDYSIWRFKALRLRVGLILLVLWGVVFSLFQPMTKSSGSMFDLDSSSMDIDYTNMMICGIFTLLLGMFFFAVTLSPVVRQLAIEPARNEQYSSRFFQFVGVLLVAIGVIWTMFSIAEPF